MTYIHHGNMHEFHERVVRVFLDGTELDGRHVCEANDEDGFVIVIIPDKDGQIFCDTNDEIRTARLSGRVDITFNGADLTREQYLECAKFFQKKRLKVG